MRSDRAPVAPMTALRGGLSGLHPRELPDPRAPHETHANAVLRPVVFGANDGLVSNLALLMGVAGANPEPGVIVLAGIAGLIAGAFSMGVGEYISVQSQQELLDYQVAFQRRQLRETPAQGIRGGPAAAVTSAVGAFVGGRT